MKRYLLGVAIVMCGSCATTRGGAVDYFSRATSCPSDRIEIADADPPARRMVTPPADVAADPARLAVWTDAQRDAAMMEDAVDSSKDWYLVSGCGEKRYLACHSRTRRHVGEGVAFNYVDCTSAWLPLLLGMAHGETSS